MATLLAHTSAMSSDDLFSDIDDAALAEIDRIEAEATQNTKAPPPPKPSVPDPDDSYFDDPEDDVPAGTTGWKAPYIIVERDLRFAPITL